MSSLSTTASGVATSPGSTPASPSTSKRRSVCGVGDGFLARRGRAAAAISSKRTTSPTPRDNVSCTIAIERIRAPTPRSPPRLGRLEPAALEPEQRGDRLQVVLHPVMDLADRGVLRQQDPVPAPEVGDVAHQHHDARDLVTVEHRQARTSSETLALFDLFGHRHAGDGGRGGGVLLEAHLLQLQTGGVGVDAHAVHRTDDVGTREADAQVASSTITPSPTRGASSNSTSSSRNGNVPSADHAREPLEQPEVVVLQLADAPAERQPSLAGEHRDDCVAQANRDALDVGAFPTTREAVRHPRGSPRSGRRVPRAAAPRRRPPCRRGPWGTRSARSSAAPGRGSRSGAASPSSGASNSRSEKQRSASSCHEAVSRCTWRDVSPRSGTTSVTFVRSRRCAPGRSGPAPLLAWIPGSRSLRSRLHDRAAARGVTRRVRRGARRCGRARRRPRCRTRSWAR